MLYYTQGAKGGSTAEANGHYSGLFAGANEYPHSGYVAHNFLINQHNDWPGLMSYLVSHIYDRGSEGKVRATLSDGRYGPYCYDGEESVHGHRFLMLPAFGPTGTVDNMVFIEVSASYGYNPGHPNPIIGLGFLQQQ